jgi:hypothetical protein
MQLVRNDLDVVDPLKHHRLTTSLTEYAGVEAAVEYAPPILLGRSPSG